jgi:uncharacterized protein YkwD
MVRSIPKAVVAGLLGWSAVCALSLSGSMARGQVAIHRDFDVEQMAAADAGQDGVVRAAAIDEIVKRTNRLRQEHDRGKITVDKKLATTAQQFADYMARTDRYGHQADGQTPTERVTANGYEYCLVAENIAMRYNSAGYETAALAEGFVKGWIDSPEHRKNMLDPDVTEIGVGLAMSKESGRYYAVQLFGRPKSAVIELAITNQSGTEVEYELEDQSFSLPPHVTRTHGRCRPPELSVQFPEQKPQSITVKKSARYVVEKGNDGRLRLVSRPAGS